MTDKPRGPVPVDPTTLDDHLRPQNWWQWMVLFPTLALALITAVPNWIDSVQALIAGVKDRKYSEALESAKLFRNNIDCNPSYAVFNPTTTGRMVDATLCPTGDLFVRVRVPDADSPLAVVDGAHKYREWSDYVSIDRVLANAQIQSAADLLGLAAFAGTVPRGPPLMQSYPKIALVPVQSTFALVVCQKFIDDRMLLRHVQEGAQCFDETVDTFTGATVSRVPVQCRTTC